MLDSRHSSKNKRVPSVHELYMQKRITASLFKDHISA